MNIHFRISSVTQSDDESVDTISIHKRNVVTSDQPIPNGSVKRTKRQDEKLGGGIQFARAWLYDGFQWNEIADMSEPRDRPACSLVQLEDGAVRQKNSL